MTQLKDYDYYCMAFAQFQRYQLDNAWFKFEFDGKEFDLQAPVSYIFAGWRAYDKAQAPTSKMLLLGDTKLRSDEELIQNFGLSSAKGVQDKEALAAVEKAIGERAKTAAGVPQPEVTWLKDEKGHPRKAYGEKPIPVIGEGAILSTKAWSPLLNDSFIMSGAHKGWDFVVALSADEGTQFQKVQSEGGDPKSIWKKFILQNSQMIWDKKFNIPRVLTRELLGLELFGYKPSFDKHQLWFTVGDKSKSDGATLSQYLVALKDYGFHDRKKESLVQRISAYLFGDGKALDAI